MSRKVVVSARLRPETLASLYIFFKDRSDISTSSGIVDIACQTLYQILEKNGLMSKLSDDDVISIIASLSAKNKPQVLRDISSLVIDKEMLDSIIASADKDDHIDIKNDDIMNAIKDFQDREGD